MGEIPWGPAFLFWDRRAGRNLALSEECTNPAQRMAVRFPRMDHAFALRAAALHLAEVQLSQLPGMIACGVACDFCRAPRRVVRSGWPHKHDGAKTLRKSLIAAPVLGVLAATGALAADPPAPDPDLAKFREAYTTGSGLAYVVVKDDKGETIYRYGDASRQAAQKDTRGYMLFTCASPHVFVVQNPPDKANLLKARVVKAGEPDFKDLDAKYISGCKNPFVKSALPQSK
jgi:hypothetical protein